MEWAIECIKTKRYTHTHTHTHVYFPQYRGLTSEKRKYLKTERPHRNAKNISEFFNPNKR